MTELIVFITGTLVLAWISRRSLRDRRAHGFYRLFAFLAILGLIVRNIGYWFSEPLSHPQLASWVLLTGSMVLVLHAFRLLTTTGQPHAAVPSGPNLAFENTTVLVTRGVYRHIRHPMYASLLLLCWGVFLKHPETVNFVVSLAGTGFLFATAKAEESENLRRFGEEYREFMRHTRMFIPYLW